MVLKRIFSYYKENKWAAVIGLGIALYPIHNLWFTEITSFGGMTTIFIPAIGAVIWIMAVLIFVQRHWKELSIGKKKVYIPLLLIVVSIGISGIITRDTISAKAAPLLIGAVFFASYAVARVLGQSIFRMLIPFVILGIIISTVMGIMKPGIPAGGLITNYCASAGFIIFGTVVNQGRKQWQLVLASLVGLFFIGAVEGLFIVGVMGKSLLIRRDFNKYLLIIAGVLIVGVVAWLIGGKLIPLLGVNNNVVYLLDIITGKTPLTHDSLNYMTSMRWEVYMEALDRINIFGHGFSLDLTQGRIVHNVPLIIVDQIGIVAALAWSWVTLYCAVKTKWHYAWIAVMAMCVFDHYIWTQFGPMWWILIGVSTTSQIKNDFIFKGGE